MKTVWLVMQEHDTGDGTHKTVYGVYASERVAFAAVSLRAASFLHAIEQDCVAVLMETYGRTHWWEGRSVRFHHRLGPTRDCVGFTIVESKVIELVCSCGHDADDTVPGRDDGYVACANCGMQ